MSLSDIDDLTDQLFPFFHARGREPNLTRRAMKVTISSDISPSDLLAVVCRHHEREAERLAAMAFRATGRDKTALESLADYAREQAEFWRSVEVR